jgi:hypothetical protein
MKKIFLLAAVLVSAPAFAQYYNQPAQSNYNSGLYGSDQQTSGYTRSNGTVVQGYHHTAPDSNPYNNYSSQGNVNPYTGAVGHKAPRY